jgi:hypothetical protein
MLLHQNEQLGSNMLIHYKRDLGSKMLFHQNQNMGSKMLFPSQLRPKEQNVVLSKLIIDEPNNLCGLKLIMVIICNSNDEITPNTYWEFRSRNGGLDYFRIYIH